MGEIPLSDKEECNEGLNLMMFLWGILKKITTSKDK